MISQHSINPQNLSSLKNILDINIQKNKLNTSCTLKFGWGKSKDGLSYFEDTFIFNDIWEEVKIFLEQNYPLFKYSQIYIHCNFSAPHHKDEKVNGNVLCIGFGDYEGGELNIKIEDGSIKQTNTRYNPTLFPGGILEHWNSPITNGRKYSLCVISVKDVPNYN